jgi:hypothetical protein
MRQALQLNPAGSEAHAYLASHGARVLRHGRNECGSVKVRPREVFSLFARNGILTARSLRKNEAKR